MNDKITFPRVVSLLAQASGFPKEICEDFLRELTLQISDSLVAGENVRLSGIGTFKLIDIEPRKSVDVSTGSEIEIEGHRKVVFVAAKEIAAAVNAPFEAFEAVEISDDAEKALLEESDDALLDAPAINDAVNADDENGNVDNEEEIEITLNVDDCGNGISTNAANEPTTEDSIDPKEESVINDIDETASTDIKVSTVDEMPPADEEGSDNAASPSPEIHIDETPTEKCVNVDIVLTDSSDNDCQDRITAKDTSAETADTKINTTSTDCQPEKPRSHRFLWGFLSGFVIGEIVIVLILFLFMWISGKNATDVFHLNYNETTVEKTDTADTQRQSIKIEPINNSAVNSSAVNSEEKNVSNPEGQSDGNDVADTKPSDEKRYDTITTTRYLTTMAKEYYGNFNLWPYIYLENQDFLGHPDKIRPGTRVVIPPLSKYGVDPGNKAHIDKAKKLGVEIYAKYK